MNDDRNRSYSEDEFALILRKASELQAQGPRGDAAKAGLGLAEIKQIASEVGIEPEFIERAALMARNSGVDEDKSIMGGPMRMFHSKEIAGELSESDLGRLMDSVRETMGDQGVVTEVLDSVEWSSTPGLRRVHVLLTPRDGKTQVQVRVDQSGVALLSFVFPGIVTLISTLAIGQALEPGLVGSFGLVVGAGLGGFTVARTIFKHFSDGFRVRLGSGMKRLQEFGDALAGASRAQTPELPDRTEDPS